MIPQEDTACFRERIDREISVLEAMTDLPPSLVPAVQAARRLMRNGTARDFDMPEPVDAHAASMIVIAIQDYLTERTMHNAWRKRAEEAESTLADLRRQVAALDAEWRAMADLPHPNLARDHTLRFCADELAARLRTPLEGQ